MHSLIKFSVSLAISGSVCLGADALAEKFPYRKLDPDKTVLNPIESEDPKLLSKAAPTAASAASGAARESPTRKSKGSTGAQQSASAPKK